MIEKICTKCNQLKNINLFYNCKTTLDKKTYKCAECIKKYTYQYSKENREKVNILNSIHYYKNKVKRNKLHAEYIKKRMLIDPMFTLRRRLVSRTAIAFKKANILKTSKTYQMLGCSSDELRNHISNLFIDDMSWDNRTQWHLDHIIPLSSATTKEELIKLCHYTNLQPLWAEDNLKKGSKILNTV